MRKYQPEFYYLIIFVIFWEKQNLMSQTTTEENPINSFIIIATSHSKPTSLWQNQIFSIKSTTMPTELPITAKPRLIYSWLKILFFITRKVINLLTRSIFTAKLINIITDFYNVNNVETEKMSRLSKQLSTV